MGDIVWCQRCNGYCIVISMMFTSKTCPRCKGSGVEPSEQATPAPEARSLSEFLGYDESH